MRRHEQRMFSKMLGTFPYGHIQSALKTAAKRYGILVYEIDPKYTSMTCPFCGELYEEKWVETDKFAFTAGGEPIIDKNTNQQKHREQRVVVEECPRCHNRMHHDHKGALNIARSFKVEVDIVGHVEGATKNQKAVLTNALKYAHPVISSAKKHNKLCASEELPIYTLNKSGKSFDKVIKRKEFSKNGFSILGRKESMPQFLEEYNVDGYEFVGWRINGEDKIYYPFETFTVNRMFMRIEGVWKKVDN